MTQEAKTEAGIQWSPKSAYFWFNDILDSGLRRYDDCGVNGTLVVGVMSLTFVPLMHSRRVRHMDVPSEVA